MIVLATLNARYGHAALGLRCLLANLGDLRRHTTLIEGVMAIQRIIGNDNIPKGPDGKRLPLNLVVQPNAAPRPQPVPVSIGQS